ncbi:hypothetical protein ES332_D04G172700v1 [Gossypium tomentosum]|uniref:Uncharacterized protein n=1 Tax=Gossypium tomentosum TaxID=34277 RepID=A0A5D2LFH8_GOSTO|nr:hypothetical protein ES332_D04G172700v1 [Gossypium tomentosum]
MLRRSCAFDLCQDSDCNGDGQRSGGQVRRLAGVRRHRGRGVYGGRGTRVRRLVTCGGLGGGAGG